MTWARCSSLRNILKAQKKIPIRTTGTLTVTTSIRAYEECFAKFGGKFDFKFDVLRGSVPTRKIHVSFVMSLVPKIKITCSQRQPITTKKSLPLCTYYNKAFRVFLFLSRPESCQ